MHYALRLEFDCNALCSRPIHAGAKADGLNPCEQKTAIIEHGNSQQKPDQYTHKKYDGTDTKNFSLFYAQTLLLVSKKISGTYILSYLLVSAGLGLDVTVRECNGIAKCSCTNSEAQNLD